MNERFRAILRRNQGQEEPKVLPGSSKPENPRYSQRLHIHEFELPPDIEAGLTKEQRQLLDLSVSAGRSMARIFNAQEGRGERANFYPERVPKDVVLNAGKNNPEILSHYTVVIRKQDGTLEPVPMHLAYTNIIQAEKIPQKLLAASDSARRAGDPTTSLSLRAIAESFSTGDYKRSEIIRLTRKDEPPIDPMLGFYDTYTDKFLGIKYAAEAWVGVQDRKSTEDAKWFQDQFLRVWEGETGLKAPKNIFLFQHTKGMYGQAAKYDWIANSLPCQIDWRHELGSKSTIFVPNFTDQFIQKKLPVFKSVVSPRRRVVVADSLVETVNRRLYIGHELAHSLVPEGADRRLRELASPMKELFCDLRALKGYATIPADGKKLVEREKGVAIGALLSAGVQEYLNFKRDQSRPEYYVSSSVLLKYLTESGSARIVDGRIDWENPLRIIDDASSLLSITQNILNSARYGEAREFLSRYFDGEIYRPLANNIVETSPFDLKRYSG